MLSGQHNPHFPAAPQRRRAVTSRGCRAVSLSSRVVAGFLRMGGPWTGRASHRHASWPALENEMSLTRARARCRADGGPAGRLGP